MSRPLTALTLIAALAACDNANPFQGGGTVDPGPAPVIDPDNPVGANGIPVSLSGTGGAQNLSSVQYDPGAGTLAVDMAALDRNDEDIPLEDYTFNANLTALAPGYQVFSYQDDGLDRMFVAIVAESTDGSVVGAVVMDGGQFNKFFGGGFYATDGNYSPGNPSNDTGLVSYAGNYAAVTNLDANGNELIAVPPGTDPILLPSQPAQISGEIFINADFGDNSVNGAIYNRSFQNLDPVIQGIIGGADLGDIVLTPATITNEGTFFGTAENPAQDALGNYGGTFGGTESSGVAGVVSIDGDFIAGIDNEHEFGVFVLTQCGQPGEAAICDDIPVNPNP